jgi:hypothetical protein
MLAKAFLRLVLLWCGLTAAVLDIRSMARIDALVVPTLLNSGVIFVLYAVFFFLTPLFEFYRSMPKVHRMIFTVVVTLTVFCHLLSMGRATFPFARWDMFTWNWDPDAVVFHEVYGVRNDNSLVELNVAKLFPSLHTCFYWEFESRGEAVRVNPNAVRSYDDVLAAIGRRHNELDAENRISAVVVVRGVIALDEGGKSIRRQEMRRVELPEEQPR